MLGACPLQGLWSLVLGGHEAEDGSDSDALNDQDEMDDESRVGVELWIGSVVYIRKVNMFDNRSEVDDEDLACIISL